MGGWCGESRQIENDTIKWNSMDLNVYYCKSMVKKCMPHKGQEEHYRKTNAGWRRKKNDRHNGKRGRAVAWFHWIFTASFDALFWLSHSMGFIPSVALHPIRAPNDNKFHFIQVRYVALLRQTYIHANVHKYIVNILYRRYKQLSFG